MRRRLVFDRRSRSGFTLSRACQLTLAGLNVTGRVEGYVIFNSMDFLHITKYAAYDSVPSPARSVPAAQTCRDAFWSLLSAIRMNASHAAVAGKVVPTRCS